MSFWRLRLHQNWSFPLRIPSFLVQCRKREFSRDIIIREKKCQFLFKWKKNLNERAESWKIKKDCPIQKKILFDLILLSSWELWSRSKAELLAKIVNRFQVLSIFFRAPKLCRNYAFPQNFHTMKLGRKLNIVGESCFAGKFRGNHVLPKIVR